MHGTTGGPWPETKSLQVTNPYMIFPNVGANSRTMTKTLGLLYDEMALIVVFVSLNLLDDVINLHFYKSLVPKNQKSLLVLISVQLLLLLARPQTKPHS